MNSEKQKSGQSSVFFVKEQHNLDEELVLKIFKENEMKFFHKEEAIMTRLKSKVGFPQIVSKKESESQAEILMAALGPSLKKLVK